MNQTEALQKEIRLLREILGMLRLEEHFFLSGKFESLQLMRERKELLLQELKTTSHPPLKKPLSSEIVELQEQLELLRSKLEKQLMINAHLSQTPQLQPAPQKRKKALLVIEENEES